MSNIHNLSDKDFEAFEADMFEQAEKAVDTWMVGFEADAAFREGWNALTVWAKKTSRTSVIIDVGVNGDALYSVIYRKEFGEKVWTEASYTDMADGREMIKPSSYEGMGYTRLDGWRWNEYTDAWEICLDGLDALIYNTVSHGFSKRYPLED